MRSIAARCCPNASWRSWPQLRPYNISSRCFYGAHSSGELPVLGREHVPRVNYVCAESASRGRGADFATRRVKLGARGDPAASFFSALNGYANVRADQPVRPVASCRKFRVICLTAAGRRVNMNRVRAKTARFPVFFHIQIGLWTS